MIRAGPSEAVRTMQEEHWGRGSSSGGLRLQDGTDSAGRFPLAQSRGEVRS